ncbi:MAG: GspE/PulE family protein [Planctomycetes bacterium]|nr:GspE/PulE family protein [Planctomycetota bacterium]
MNPRQALDAVVQAGLVGGEAAARIQRELAATPQADPVRTISLFARLPSAAVWQALAAARGLEFAARERLTPPRALAERLPRALLQRRLVAPLADDGRTVLVAAGDLEAPDDQRLRETLQHALGRPVRFALADPDELRAAIARLCDEPARPASAASAEDAVALVEEVLRAAWVRRASDIHIEPDERGHRIRLRIDGALVVHQQDLPRALALALISRIKVLAGMDIAESREPQDGSLVHRIRGAEDQGFDIRVATAPTRHGERATLRLLGADHRDLSLGDLGFSPAMQRRFQELIRRPSGLILLTGPTGSGKTTTLYAALRELNRPDCNLMTVEDPVEYSIPGVSQLEVDDAGKLTFPMALRSLLRHDPDVLMVGEIRDRETADMALRAAMTGHLVLSTLHTSTAVGAVTRLIDLGCQPFLVAATLVAAVSQRLVRRLCPACRRERPPEPGDALLLGAENAGPRFAAAGCIRCQGGGHLGRVALCEMFEVDDAARALIAARGDEDAIARAAQRLTTLRSDAAAKVHAGLTTVDEVRQLVAWDG